MFTFYWQLSFVDYHDYLTPSSDNYSQLVVKAVGYSNRDLISRVHKLKPLIVRGYVVLYSTKLMRFINFSVSDE